MTYKVINEFRDTDNLVYKVGEVYPKDGYTPTQKRIKELSEVHSKYKKTFIVEVETDEEKAEREAEEKAIADQKIKEENEAKAKAEAEQKAKEESEAKASSKRKSEKDTN